MSEKETCPYCGGEYKRLTTHLPYCKQNPDNMETEGEYLISVTVNSIDDYSYSTSEPIDENIIEAPPHECPYLVVIAGNACSTCRGISCMASKDKKISDVEYCKTEWPDCLQYLEAIENGVRAVCPYYGFPPPEKPECCSGQYCYAREAAVKVLKACLHWQDCTDFLMSKYEGKPFHRSKI